MPLASLAGSVVALYVILRSACTRLLPWPAHYLLAIPVFHVPCCKTKRLNYMIETGGGFVVQAGPPYALDPSTLGTLGSSPELLDGLLIDGIAPSTTGSDFLDQVPSRGFNQPPVPTSFSRVADTLDLLHGLHYSYVHSVAGIETGMC